jgi:hypothetical protein
MGNVRYLRVPPDKLVDPVRIRIRPLERSVQVEIDEGLIDPLLTDHLGAASGGLTTYLRWRTTPAPTPPVHLRLSRVQVVPGQHVLAIDSRTPGRIEVRVLGSLMRAELVPHLQAHVNNALRFFAVPTTDLPGLVMPHCAAVLHALIRRSR